MAYVGLREPRPAAVPPVLGGRFTVALDGVDEATISNYWRELCQDHGAPPTPEFKSVYSQFAVLRGSKFRFRSGDREQIRGSLERLFKKLSPTATAALEN